MPFNRTFAALILCLVGAALCNVASADEHHAHRDFGRDREIYRSPHWVFDDRHHHGHYYPAVGYVVLSLPPAAITVGFGGRRLFFGAGVWYEVGPSGYVVVRPPLGVVAPVLPPGYSTVYVGNVPYYYANDTYYVAGPGGYAVAAAPTTYVEKPQPPLAAGAPLPPAPQASAPPPAPAAAAQPVGDWYWCDAAKAYYPYVQSCPAGWRKVPAKPPGMP